jgi:hypothetical protein
MTKILTLLAALIVASATMPVTAHADPAPVRCRDLLGTFGNAPRRVAERADFKIGPLPAAMVA